MSAIKLNVRKQTTCDTNVQLIREVENVVNDVICTICLRSTVCLKTTFRLTDKWQISYTTDRAHSMDLHNNKLYPQVKGYRENVLM